MWRLIILIICLSSSVARSQTRPSDSVDQATLDAATERLRVRERERQQPDAMDVELQQLRNENARLRDEVVELRKALGKAAAKEDDREPKQPSTQEGRKPLILRYHNADIDVAITDIYVDVSPVVYHAYTSLRELDPKPERSFADYVRGRELKGSDFNLYVMLKIENKDDRRTFNYWPIAPNPDLRMQVPSIRITDDVQNQITNTTYWHGPVPVTGSVGNTELKPSTTLVDVNVFEMPRGDFKSLTLSIPADLLTFNSEDVLLRDVQFRIAPDMIRRIEY